MIGKLLLCGGYLLLGLWIIQRSRLFKQTELSDRAFLLLYGVRLLAGLAYVYVFFSMLHGGDALQMYRGGRVVWEAFQEDPAIYFRLIFGPNGGFVETPVYKYAFATNYWDHFDKWNIIRFHALLSPITMGSYWVHVVIFTAMNVWGSLLFYEAFRQMTTIPKRLLFVLVFLMPSLLLFTSMMYKEGFLYFGLALIIYHMWQLDQSWSWKSFFGVLLGLALFFLFRQVFFGLILGCLMLFLFGKMMKWSHWQPYLFTVVLSLVIGLSADHFIDQVDVLRTISTKQAAFISEVGESDFEVPYLEPNLQSFICFLPIALQNAFLRPFLWDISESYFALTGIGMIFFLALALLRILFPKPDHRLHPWLLTLVLFSWSVLLLVGYLVSNVGTISRYRILPVFLLIIVLANAINWNEVLNFLPQWIKVLVQTETRDRNTPP
ncbi:MAG: hypothetical protein AAF598_16305 [Bacteroidota bacterium]